MYTDQLIILMSETKDFYCTVVFQYGGKYTENEIKNKMDNTEYYKETSCSSDEDAYKNEYITLPSNKEFKVMLEQFDIGKNMIKSFVVAKEILSDEELKKLIPYCRCAYHTSHALIKIPNYNAPCPCCVGCLCSEREYIQQHVIDKTRKYYKEYNNNPGFFKNLTSFFSGSCRSGSSDIN